MPLSAGGLRLLIRRLVTGALHASPLTRLETKDALLGEEWNVNQAPAKANRKFPHHMIREIYEQPDAVRRVLIGPYR